MKSINIIYVATTQKHHTNHTKPDKTTPHQPHHTNHTTPHQPHHTTPTTLHQAHQTTQNHTTSHQPHYIPPTTVGEMIAIVYSEGRRHPEGVALALLAHLVTCPMIRTRAVAYCGGAVWCGVVWYGVTWCGPVWCGVMWCSVV